MKELEGKNIKEMWVGDCAPDEDGYYNKSGERYLKFVTNEGEFTYIAVGGCCSISYFAEVISPEAVLGECVYHVVVVDMPRAKDGRSRKQEDEPDKVYGVFLEGSGGTCQIVFRNSSNGYYGGECELVGPEPDEDRSLPTNWRRIESDWTAWEGVRAKDVGATDRE